MRPLPDHRSLRSARLVVAVSGGLVALAFVAGDPSVPVAALFFTVVLGFALIRLRPTWAFAALFFAARGFIIPDASVVGIVVSLATILIVYLIGTVAIRSLRRIKNI